MRKWRKNNGSRYGYRWSSMFSGEEKFRCRVHPNRVYQHSRNKGGVVCLNKESSKRDRHRVVVRFNKLPRAKRDEINFNISEVMKKAGVSK
jgi:hypothetical protein